jgi:hypothetical protein
MKSATAAAIAAVLIASLAGCATTRGPRHVDEVVGAAARPESDWSRVAQIAPGAEIVVTLTRARAMTRSFVSANASTVTVLNLTNAALPPVAIRVLREMAARQPENFAAMRGSASFAVGDVRVGRDGVFVGGRKAAELAQVVETLARNDVAEISGPVVARGSVLGAVVGGWVGFAIGVVPGLGGVSAGLAWPLAIASMAVGGYLGSHWSSHETDGVIYQTP